MNKVFLGLLVIVIGVILGWYVFGGLIGLPIWFPRPGSKIAATPTPGLGLDRGSSPLGVVTPTLTSGESEGKGGVSERTVVTFTNSGFAPSPVTVKKGTMVAFVNDSNSSMWVASDPHPSHTGLPGLDQLKSVGKGGSYEYQFTKAGTWGYHNHAKPEQKGTVVVTE